MLKFCICRVLDVLGLLNAVCFVGLIASGDYGYAVIAAVGTVEMIVSSEMVRNV